MLFRGIVINGNKIGRRIGFPTANIRVDAAEPVQNGVYAARVEVDGRWYDAMVNVGLKPTVGGTDTRTLEANLFGFEGDLYDREIAVRLGEFIRPERRFDSIEALRRQIETDRNEILKRIRK